MDSSPEVALFVDFENIRYSVLNTFHREVCGAMLMDVAHRYGRVTTARAYANFDDHPERVLRDLQVAGIQAVGVPAPQSGDRARCSSDLEMATDLFETLLDCPNLKTVVVMTGDRRFIRVVNMIRHRFDLTAVVAGVCGSVSNDLIEAACGRFEPLEFETVPDDDRRRAFVRFVDRLERSKPFITFKYVAAAMSTSTDFPGLAEDEAREFVAQAIQDGVLVKHQRPDGYRVLHLDRESDDVLAVFDPDNCGEPLEGNGYHDDGYDYEDDTPGNGNGHDDGFDDAPDSEDPAWNR